MPNLRNALRLFAAHADDWRTMARARGVDITPALRGSKNLEDAREAGVNIGAAAQLRGREFFLSHGLGDSRNLLLGTFFYENADEPNVINNLINRSIEAHKAGADPDPVPIARDMMLNGQAKRTLLKDSDLQAIDPFEGVSPEIVDMSLSDMLATIAHEREAAPSPFTSGRQVGSEPDGSVDLPDIAGAIRSEEIMDEAAGNPLRASASSSLRDLAGEGTEIFAEAEAEIRAAARMVNEGTADSPLPTGGPSIEDKIAHAAPSSLAQDTRDADPARRGPTFTAGSVERILNGDSETLDNLTKTVEHNKRGGKGPRPKDDRIVGGGTTDDPPPGLGGGTVHPWAEIARAAGGGIFEPANRLRYPVAVLGQKVVAPIQLAANNAWDQIAGFMDYLGPRVKQVPMKQDDAMDWHVGRRLDLTDGMIRRSEKKYNSLREAHMEIEEKLRQAEEDLAAADLQQDLPLPLTPSGSRKKALKRIAGLTKSADDVEKKLKQAYADMLWFKEQRQIADDFHAALPPEMRQKVDDLVDATRRSLDAVILMLKHTGKMRGKWGQIDGPGLGDYFQHIFPEHAMVFKMTSPLPAEMVDDILHGSGKAPFMLPRKGATGYSFSYMKMVNGYFPQAAKKMYLHDAVYNLLPKSFNAMSDADADALRAMLGQERFSKNITVDENPLTASFTPIQREYAINWAMGIMGVPTTPDRMITNNMRGLLIRNLDLQKKIDAEKHPKIAASLKAHEKSLLQAMEDPRPALKMALWLNHRSMMGAIAFNPTTPLKNLTQPVSTVAEVGLLPYLVAVRSSNVGGILKARKALREGKALPDKMSVGMATGVMSETYSFSREFERMLANDPVTGKLVSESIIPKDIPGFLAYIDREMNEIGMAGMTATEYSNRTITNLAGIANALAKRGLRSYQEAVRAGVWNDCVAEGRLLDNAINFQYGTFGMSPYLMRGPVGRTALQFGTYNYMMAETGLRWAKQAVRGKPEPMLTFMLATGKMQGIAWRYGLNINDWFGVPGSFQPRIGRELPIQAMAQEAMTASWKMVADGLINGNKREMTEAQDRWFKAMAPYFIKGYIFGSRFLPNVFEERQTGITDLSSGMNDLKYRRGVHNSRGQKLRDYRITGPDIMQSIFGLTTREGSLTSGAVREVSESQQNKGVVAEATQKVAGAGWAEIEYARREGRNLSKERLAKIMKTIQGATDDAVAAGLDMETWGNNVIERVESEVGEPGVEAYLRLSAPEEYKEWERSIGRSRQPG